MLNILAAVIDAYVGHRWRVTATRQGGLYLIDVDNGQSIVRGRGKTLEQAEDDVAVQVGRRLRQRYPDDLLPLLQAALVSLRRQRGLPPVRLVKPQDPTGSAEALARSLVGDAAREAAAGEASQRSGDGPANDNEHRGENAEQPSAKEEKEES